MLDLCRQVTYVVWLRCILGLFSYLVICYIVVFSYQLFGCSLPQVPVPSVPTYQPTTPIPQRLEAIQKYIRELQYPPRDQRCLCLSFDETCFTKQ